MGQSRFLKTVRARHTHGRIVVKTFVKPHASLTLRHLVRRLRTERETLAGIPNVLTYQHVIETDRAGYLIRQWVASSLYDRISTRPFLTTIEKKWVTYQLLFAMKASREKQIAHGDLKTENILVTSSLSVYVTDFAASFKPVYLPLDDPADYAFFFDTSGRRTCYVAPERFYSADSDIAREKASLRTGVPPSNAPTSAGVTSITSSGDPYSEILGLGKRDGKITEAMDVFSMGCVIAELWRDGTPMFTLSQMFRYREGQFDVAGSLAEIPDDGVRTLVKSMISIDARDRSTFGQYLQTEGLFPSCFEDFLHPYLVDLQRFSPAPKSAKTSSVPAEKSQATGSSTASAEPQYNAEAEATLDARRQADLRLERIYEEWSVITAHLDQDPVEVCDDAELDGGATCQGLADDCEHILPVQLNIPGLASTKLKDHTRRVTDDGPALILLSPILSNLRNALRASTKEHALDLLLHLSARWLTDETKLDRVLPYLVALLDDPSPSIRAATVRSIAQLLLLVGTITASNESVCLEYLFPNLRRVTSNPSPLVRSMYAACFSSLLTTARRFLQQSQALKASGIFAADQDLFDEVENQPGAGEATYDAQLQELKAFAQDQATQLLTDSVPAVKRLLLAEIRPLCQLLGMATTNDVLLSHMITYLNDQDWQLRHAFFDAIVEVAHIAGPRSVEEYVVPLMTQALSDAEEFVIVRVLLGLSQLVKVESFLSQDQLYDLVSSTAGFLCHPDLWIRQAASRFLVAAASRTDSTDLWTMIYPSIRPLLKMELQSFDRPALLASVKSPLSRNIIQAALTWASTAGKTSFWKPDDKTKVRAGVGDSLAPEGLALIASSDAKQGTGKTPLSRSEEDDGFLDKLRALGLAPEDEVKLVALREHLWKLSRQSGRPRSFTEDDSSGNASPAPRRATEVQEVEDVTPQTIFFSYNKGGDASAADTQKHGSVRSVTSSSYTGQLARKRMMGQRTVSGGSASPLEDLRRRMDMTSLGRQSPSLASRSHSRSASGLNEAVRPLTNQRTVSSGQARLGLGGKAAPATATESTANATGTMGELAGKLRSMQMAGEAGSVAGSATPTIRPGEDAAANPQGTADGPIFRSTYEGSDPYIQAHLEDVFVRNFRDRTAELGPRVAAGSTTRRRGVGNRSSSSAMASSSKVTASVGGARRPEGKLIAYFNEHTAPITCLAISPDHAFFASGSEDGTIKIWDTARLEKNVTSRSRATYTAHSGRISALIALEGTHCFASAATDGSLHVWRVDLALSSTNSLPRYGKPRLVSNFQLSTPGEYATCLLQSSVIDTPSSAKLILGTGSSRITILDLRTMQVLQALKNPPQVGPITCFCADRKRTWLVVGTLNGVVLLWDLRFSLLVKSWRVGDSGRGGSARVTGLGLHPSRGRGRWVMVSYSQTREAKSAGQTIIETWDIDRGVLVETYEVSKGAIKSTTASQGKQNAASSRMEGLSSPAAAIERLVNSKDADRSSSDADNVATASDCHVKAFLSGLEGYSSGPLSSASSNVPGGWLDAGRLAAEAPRPGQSEGVASSASGPGPAGYLLSAGEDGLIRFWDLGRAEKSVGIGAPLPSTGGGTAPSTGDEFKMIPSANSQAEGGSGSNGEATRFVHQQTSSTASPSSMRSPLLAHQSTQEAQRYLRSHRDAITALGVLELPFRCIVAGDRTGAVKVWE